MMKKTLFLFVCVLFISIAASAQVPFRTDQQAYQFGYSEGYQHGVADVQSGENFNYSHSHRFQSGISYNSYVNAQFRSGYIQGYRDGFYTNQGSYYEDRYYEDRDDHYYGDNRDYNRNDYQNGAYGGFVTVFTDDRFDGSRVSFRSGRYPDLNGKLHNSIDSVEVRGPVRVILFDKTDFRGKSIIIDGDVFDLDDYDFGDKAESMIVEQH